MVDTKKPAQSAPATTTSKPAINTTTRAPLPSLSPLADAKPTAASIQPAAPSATTTASEKAAQPASASAEATAAPTAAIKPLSTEAKPAASPASTSKPIEKLGPKLRKRDEILNALRAGGKIEKVDGLFRIVNADGTKNATSKRRILSLESQKLLVASADGKTFTLDADADKKAKEPKAAPATKPAAEKTK